MTAFRVVLALAGLMLYVKAVVLISEHGLRMTLVYVAVAAFCWFGALASFWRNCETPFD